MARITYIEFGGTEHVVEVANGLTVMEGARDNNIPGIEADCGGACACSTCHVYVDEDWEARLTPRATDEQVMVEDSGHYQDNSRLACQVPFTDDLDGIRLTLAPEY